MQKGDEPEFNGFNRTIVNDLPSSSTTTTLTTKPIAKRQISMVPLDILQEAEEPAKPVEASKNIPSNVLLITNLVRPFTLPQLRELLLRTGELKDIWIDKIKSKCIAKYANADEAFETRAALHGIKWPPVNNKTLAVDYSTEEFFEKNKSELVPSSSTAERIQRHQDDNTKPEISGMNDRPVREWDMGKKRSRSRSPGKRDGNRTRRSRSNERGEQNAQPQPQQGKALDELFRKTVATPQIYWLPLTPKQISEKEELRRKRLEEREKRIAEIAAMQSRPAARMR